MCWSAGAGHFYTDSTDVTVTTMLLDKIHPSESVKTVDLVFVLNKLTTINYNKHSATVMKYILIESLQNKE